MKILAAALLAVVLAGCNQAIKQPTRTSAVEPPTTWASAEPDSAVSASAPDRWWADFADQGLDGAIDKTLDRNLDLRAAAARITAAEQQLRIARGAELPELSASLNRSRSRRNFIGFPIPGSESNVLSTTFTQYDLGLNASWEPDFWNRVKSGKVAAGAELSASRADLAASQLSLSGRVAKAWFAAIEANRQLGLARASRETYVESAQLIERRFRAGLRSSLDLRLAQTEIERSESQVLQREEQLARAIRQLEVLTGGYPSGEYPIAEDLPSLAESVPAGLPAAIVSRRPDLAAAEARVLAADARIVQSKANLKPRFNLTGSTGTATQQLKSLVDGDLFVWSLVSGVTQPLFNRGRLRAEVKQTEARAQEAYFQFESAMLNAFGEVEAALAAEDLLAQRVEKLEAATQQSRAAQELAEKRYRAGLVDITTVLSSQRTAFDSESQWLASQRLRLDNRVDLHVALGGGFDSAGGTSPSPAGPAATPPTIAAQTEE